MRARTAILIVAATSGVACAAPVRSETPFDTGDSDGPSGSAFVSTIDIAYEEFVPACEEFVLDA